MAIDVCPIHACAVKPRPIAATRPVGALPVRQLVMSLAPPDEGIDEPQPGVGGRP